MTLGSPVLEAVAAQKGICREPAGHLAKQSVENNCICSRNKLPVIWTGNERTTADLLDQRKPVSRTGMIGFFCVYTRLDTIYGDCSKDKHQDRHDKKEGGRSDRHLERQVNRHKNKTEDLESFVVDSDDL